MLSGARCSLNLGWLPRLDALVWTNEFKRRWCWYLKVKGAWDGPEDLWCYSAACNKWRDLKSNIETTKVLWFAQETMSQKKTTNSLTQPRSDLVWLESAGGGQKWAPKTSKDAPDKPSKRRWLDSGSQEYLRSINRHQYMVYPCLTHYTTIYAKKISDGKDTTFVNGSKRVVRIKAC